MWYKKQEGCFWVAHMPPALHGWVSRVHTFARPDACQPASSLETLPVAWKGKEGRRVAKEGV